ncbi:hypothetical protein [Ralstonia pseudosolanacearum]|uniref:MarR family transcriptional regulator n=2 Tax=Ralstonia pseudosolanacearum TaxID=1310165 RepID=A0A454TXJ4_9RALS|nr:hypothetical protein [Ralstonia pseudosolanacearum]MCK4131948.1 hypothetical protein [Ralstonia pseudosolanacearum]MDK1379586.1 hypothetical protein [Ralstonia pseudosolanacearum]RAA16430.1 hypothetical protein DOT67_03090 [Ralstonia pseudosolanacearum]RNM10456.1 hypothetical protein EGA29_04265 [Ralstonia pseudosolanacearum]
MGFLKLRSTGRATMSEDIKIAILKSLSASEKNWNWYTLDCALSAQGRGGQCNVAQIATLLSEQGLITISPNENPAMPMYSITENGRRWLEGRA